MKAKIRNLYNQVHVHCTCTIPDPAGTPYGKVTKRQELKTQESQGVSHFPTCDYKPARSRQDSITKIHMNKKHRHGTVS